VGLCNSPALRPRVGPIVACAPDPLGLGDARQKLLAALSPDVLVTEADREIVSLYDESIAPFEPAVYQPGLVVDDRKSAICSLSKSLDMVEGVVRGPMLSGASLSTADASLFPSMCLLQMTLPTHFGWTEWTEEAIFWKRPRLHAWYELMMYEEEARAAERQVAAALDALQVDWEQVAVEVPTARLRSFPKHAI